MFTLARGEKAEFLQDPTYVGKRQFQAGEAWQFAQRKVDDLLLRRRIAGDNNFGRLAAAEIKHHLRCQFEARQHEGGIDTALEAVACIGIDAELASGLRDIEFVPKCGFDQYVGGLLRAPGRFAAHDAREGLDPLFVGDHAGAFIQRVGLAVEREQFFTILRTAYREIAVDLGGVEYMQRPAAVEGDEVRDIDECVDGAQSDRSEPLLQPVRRRAILDALDQPQSEGRT